MFSSKEFKELYDGNLSSFIDEEREKGLVYPPQAQVFRAFELTPIEKIRVVIIGQDPYHGDGQAEGLSFSVPVGISIPPSLRNIFKELDSDIGVSVRTSGSLESWAGQGVLLLNSVLTVRAGEPGSHRGKGWEVFTDAIIKRLSLEHENLVFLLWGKYAQEKGALIDRSKHLVLESAHPSPFSATKFFGCKHFSKTNAYLVAHGKSPILW